MKTSPLLSVVVPCYNQAKYLPDALQSIIDQRFQEWECIIVDDGSTDQTPQEAIKWCQEDSRFRYMHQQNQGLSAARNSGIRQSRGIYILPLDADDKIGPEYTDQALILLETRKQIKLVYCLAQMFGCRNGFWKLSDFKFKKLLRKNLIFCSCIYRKSDAIKIGLYDTQMKHGYEDWEFLIRFCSQIKGTVSRLELIGFYYRTKEESMVSELDADMKRKHNVIRYIQKKHKRLYRRNAIQILMNKFFYKIELLN